MIASLPIIKTFRKPKENLVVIKLQIFMVKEIPKVESNHTCLAAISLDSAVKKDENYYPEAFLKECEYIEIKGN